MKDPKWVTVTDSEHAHEREALAWFRRELPNSPVTRAWSNFSFTARNGAMYEVDLLLITPVGFYLVEFKAHSGTLSGWKGTEERLPNVLVVDDSIRASIGIAIAVRDDVDNVATRTPDAVAKASDEELAIYTRVIVDIWDDEANQTEDSTDVLSGIQALERIRRVAPQAVTIAVIPRIRDPLLLRRVIDAKPDAIVVEVELNSLAAIIHLVAGCGANCAKHQPDAVSDSALRLFGFTGLSPNEVVRVYQASELYGEIRLGVTKASLGRRRTTRLRNELISAGITGTDGQRPRWPEVIDLLMRIIGR